MNRPTKHVVQVSVGGHRVLLADSVTWIDASAREEVVVTGSHGGLYAALAGGSFRPKALFFNDAGRGKDDAGIAGLVALDTYGIAAAAVSCWSARIGDAHETLAGVVASVNETARRIGLQVGVVAGFAVGPLAATHPRLRDDRPAYPDEGSATYATGFPVAVRVLDSASLVDKTMRSAIVVTGSHGGLVGASALKNEVGAVFFNDAGVGKEGAGITRLALLERDGIPAAAVDHGSARIGDGRDTFECGIVSHANGPARDAGVSVGCSVREACGILAETLLSRSGDPRRAS